MKTIFLKKIIFLTLLTVIIPIVSYAQVVIFQPSFATQNDTLTLTFDASEGNGDLAGFGGDVYLYTGLITDKSNNDTEWNYVKPAGSSGWETYPSELKLTPLGNDIWEFEYPSSVREFYGVSAADDVEKITLLFRGTTTGTGAPDKVGRGTGGSDIFLELFKNEVSVQFLDPVDSKKLNTNEEFEVIGLGNSPAGNLNLSLKLNGTEVAQTSSSDTLKYTFSSAEEGNFTFKLVADDGFDESDSTSVTLIVSDGAELAARPDGLEDGITYGANGTSVTLSLFAPGKNDVFVIGDFTDWELNFDYQMKKDSLNPDSVWFWTEVTGLTQGEEYGFQYEIDGQLRIADPYSELVLDEFNDGYIPESVFPNLKEYPKGKTSQLVGVLFPGKQEYQWEVTDFEKPDKEEIIIYKLLLRDFIADHSYTTLIDTLDYIENLGVSAIEFLPVSEFDGNESWGYNPSSHIALDKYYGTPEAFKRFIDEAHKRGIAVILDVVLNHATGQNSLYRMYEFGSNPYFNTSPRHEFNVFNDFNHQYSGTQYYTKRMIEYWIEEYKVDGFRWDLTKGFTQNCSGVANGCTGAYQQDRVDLLKKYADYQWAADPDFYVIFEHLGTNQEESEWANYRIDEGKGIMLWGKMNGPYNEATMGYNDNGRSNLLGVLAASRGFEKRHLIGYMESHDEQWLMFKNISFGNSSGDYNIRELDTALGRQKLAGAFFFTLPGPKMLFQFGELGYGYGDNGEQCLNDSPDCPDIAPGRTENKPIRWDYWNTKGTERISLYKTWSALLNLRESSPAFTNPENTTYALSNRIKRIILEHSDTDVVIVGNFDVVPLTTTGDFTQTGTWYDYFAGTEYQVNSTDQSITLQPGEFKVFTTKEFETPDISVSNEVTDLDTPAEFKLYNNYPNPFNPSTQIEFDVAKTGMVKLEVFDILGRKVATLVNGQKTAGTYSVTFDASSLSSGVYITRFIAGNNIQVQKMTLLK
ncbi:MAG: alpha-amylase family glycosyl hydrolase [Balneola sp.]